MFEDIPRRLALAMRNPPPDTRNNKERYRLAAAFAIYSEYVGHSPLSAPKRPSVITRKEDVDPREITSLLRVSSDLFLLRKTKGFSEICRRLRSRDIQTAAQELHAASLFWKAGYDITVKPESGKTGQDFDFSAARWATIINVEVTTLEPTTFSNKKLANTLSRKRLQLPDDRPAVICCVLPEAWLRVPDIEMETMAAAYRALGASRRINAIVYMMDIVRPIEGANRHFIAPMSTTYFNRNPRLWFNTNFLDDAKFGYFSANETTTIHMPRRARPPDEFERWVDHCWQTLLASG